MGVGAATCSVNPAGKGRSYILFAMVIANLARIPFWGVVLVYYFALSHESLTDKG